MRLAPVISLLLLLVPLVSACSARREPAFIPDTQEDYKYPHPADWAVTHVSYYARSGVDTLGTRKDCTHCHAMREMAGSLNVSCVKCHGPTTSEERDGAGVTGPRLNRISQNGRDCTPCHVVSAREATPYAHYPAAAGLCGSCHETSPGHLGGSDREGVLTDRTDANCYRCHYRKDDQPVIHPALQGKSTCIGCHDPHGSSQRYFIREASIGELCLQCHDAPGGRSVHGIISRGKNCLNCHGPHSTSRKKLLLKESEDLCLSCHDSIARKVRELPHRHSGTNKGCLSCHNPHASAYDRLLVANFSMSNYNEYTGTGSSENPYALCIKCHGSELLDYKGFDTNFRDDAQVGNERVSRNLHWFHVVDATDNLDKGQGRSCRICHDAHGAVQEFSINDSWDMNGNEITILFKSTLDGGTCTNTCHQTKTYRRL